MYLMKSMTLKRVCTCILTADIYSRVKVNGKVRDCD